MARPVLLVVDDDPQVLRTLERDLRQRYAAEWRLLRAVSAETALQTLEQLLARDEPVALVLSDQRMPGHSGVELLARVAELVPTAKRVLLTAYADTDAAIAAINKAKLDHYLLKPWDPPHERLFPILDELLDDWKSDYCPPFSGVRVYGPRWSPDAHRIRDFLSRNLVPFEAVDLLSDPQVREWVQQVDPAAVLATTVVFPDGSRLIDPSLNELADRLGLRMRPDQPFYDLAIVGGGPAGLAAAVYGASEGLRTVLIEGEAPGGQAGTSSRIENYLGFPAGLSGADLTRRAVAQARKFGAEILSPLLATQLRVDGPYRRLTLSDGSELNCHAVVVATGVSYRRLDVPGIEQFTGAGVYYGSAMTEAFLCRGEEVYIVGGGNSAGQAALYLAHHACRVVLLIRGESLAASMSQYLIDQLNRLPNVSVQANSCVTGVNGDGHLERITITHRQGSDTVPTRALFVFIGARPRTEWLANVVERDAEGYILSGPDLVRNGKRPNNWPLDREPMLPETSVPGVFVAGDVRHGAIKRVASAVGEGAAAIAAVHEHLRKVR